MRGEEEYASRCFSHEGTEPLYAQESLSKDEPFIGAVEETPEPTQPSDSLWTRVRSIYYSRWLRYALLLLAMLLVHTALRNVYNSKWRDYQQLSKEVEILRARSVTLKSELMRLGKESEVIDRVQRADLGLRECQQPLTKVKLHRLDP